MWQNVTGSRFAGLPTMPIDIFDLFLPRNIVLEIPQDIMHHASLTMLLRRGDDTRFLKQCPLVSSSFLLLVASNYSPEFLSEATKLARGFINSSSKIQPFNFFVKIHFFWANVPGPNIKLVQVVEWHIAACHSSTPILLFGVLLDYLLSRNVLELDPFPRKHHRSTYWSLPPRCPPYDIGVAFFPLAERFCTNCFSHSDWSVCMDIRGRSMCCTKFPSSAYFSLIQGRDTGPVSGYCCYSYAIYASLKN